MTEPEDVSSRAEFVSFVRYLQQDLTDNPETWENPTLERFLDSLAVWVEDSANAPNLTGLVPTTSPQTWQYMAHALAAARHYE